MRLMHRQRALLSKSFFLSALGGSPLQPIALILTFLTACLAQRQVLAEVSGVSASVPTQAAVFVSVPTPPIAEPPVLAVAVSKMPAKASPMAAVVSDTKKETYDATSPALPTACEPLAQNPHVRFLEWRVLTQPGAKPLQLALYPSWTTGSVTLKLNTSEVARFYDQVGLDPTQSTATERLPRAFCRAWRAAKVIESAWQAGVSSQAFRTATVSQVTKGPILSLEQAVKLDADKKLPLWQVNAYDVTVRYQEQATAPDSLKAADRVDPKALVSLNATWLAPLHQVFEQRASQGVSRVAVAAKTPGQSKSAPNAQVSATKSVSKPLAQFEGMASYYADQFHGRRTAAGARYDKHALTAAHRSLPFGSKVRVTNTRTGKSCVVTINDRGPFHHSRTLDVSRAAANLLGLVSSGVGRVVVQVLSIPGRH